MINLYHLIIRYISTLWSRLFVTMEHPGEREPLTKFSLVIIIVLDIFLFWMIYTGISEQTKIIATPSSFASSYCRWAIENFAKIDDLNTQISTVEMLYSGYESSKSGYPNRSTFNSSTYNSYDDYSYNQTSSSPVCTNIDVLLDQVNKDPTLVRLFEKRRTNVAELAQLNASISALKANYDTKLLEKIAGSDPNNTPNPGTADTTKTNIDLLISQRTAIELQITSNRQSIIQNEFIKRIVMLAKGEGQDVLRKYSYLSSIYPIKVFGVQVLFLLPLLLIIGFWSNRSLKRWRTYQVLISSHVLVVLYIFVMLKVAELVYDLIPHVFFQRIFNLLIQFNIIGLWYYFVVAISILGTLGLIYLIQRRVRAASILQASQLAKLRSLKWDCHACGSHLPSWATHCISCGVDQYAPCISCKKPTLIWGDNCMHCGASQNHK